MPVSAEDAGTINIIEQDELMRQLVLVGGDPLPKHAERGIAVTLWQITEYLIVGAVFLDDVDDVADPRIFDFPYLYAVEPGQMLLNDAEAARLREHLLRGGFFHADDFWGIYQRANFERQMAKVFPDRKLEPIPLTHEIFHTFFDVDTIMQIPNVGNGCYGRQTWESPTDKEPRIYGISDDTGRLMVIVTYNSDLGDAWEHMDVACYPEKYSGQAYRMGINFVIYSMTH